ncbi:ribonuclease [Clostridium cellulovorans]|uniref:Ribonuclease n=1 Tax=Clostridium cellulovorans (strain ATCC 35296 / DSM 3052 / OCM 3 / 743B) TaxID=573061 RepID=D9SN75_CLOC7|nr:ribonuclease [Clostridium cellulovorans]ADL53867.1 guanine-specific ribonuclease N1 and T1 [Clostridium cellulovorans 743B]
MKKIFKKLNIFLVFALLLSSLFNTVFLTPTDTFGATTATSSSTKVINTFQGVADYIHTYGKLPSNFITKAQATSLGWKPGKNLWNYAPGKSIGGDIFINAEKHLPSASGRVWHECDINYNGGQRGADRIVFSNDGLIYGTSDHYKTFKCYYKN